MKTPLPAISLIDPWLIERGLFFSHFVYMAVFQFGDCYYVRVGYSSHIYDRLQKHIGTFPEWPIFIKIFSYDDETVAKRCERYVLSRLKPYRTKGDWSRFNSGDRLNSVVLSAIEDTRDEFHYPDGANEFSVLDVSKDEIASTK